MVLLTRDADGELSLMSKLSDLKLENLGIGIHLRPVEPNFLTRMKPKSPEAFSKCTSNWAFIVDSSVRARWYLDAPDPRIVCG